MTAKQNRLFNSWTLNGYGAESNTMQNFSDCDAEQQKGYFTRENIDFFINRAKGGVGVITVGVHNVFHDTNDKEDNVQIGVADSLDYINDVGEMIDQIHSYGARLILPLTASSFSTDNKMNELSQSPSGNEFDNITESFVRSALIAKLMGFDGVQINAVQQGYLLEQFSKTFCSLTDSKTDNNTNLESRLTFATNIVKQIKAVCGADFTVTLRFKINSFVDTLVNDFDWEKVSITQLHNIPEAFNALKLLAIAGYDALDIDAGSDNSWCLTNEPALAENDGIYTNEKRNKDISKVPVFGYGMIEDIEIAAKAMDEGIFDAISMKQLVNANNDYLERIRSGSYNDMNAFMY